MCILQIIYIHTYVHIYVYIYEITKFGSYFWIYKPSVLKFDYVIGPQGILEMMGMGILCWLEMVVGVSV